MTTDSAPTLSDRAAALIDAGRPVCLPLPDLARRLGTTPSHLAGLLEEDGRFVLVRPTLFPELALLPESERARYRAALLSAGVTSTLAVGLREPGEAPPDASVERLLRDSVSRLLTVSPEPDLLTVAEGTRQAVSSALLAAADPGRTAPSTTPPRYPTGPARDPRPRQHARRPEPRTRGSRRG